MPEVPVDDPFSDARVQVTRDFAEELEVARRVMGHSKVLAFAR